MDIKESLTKDEIIQELLELLKVNSMKREANDVFELSTYIDGLEDKLNFMTEELVNVKKQLDDMSHDTVLNNIKDQRQLSYNKIQVRCNIIKEQILIVRDNIKSKSKEMINEVKKMGKAALNKVYEVFGIQDKLKSIREHVKKTQIEVSNIVGKIDAFAKGIKDANRLIANTFRNFVDKEEKDYSKEDKKFSKTELIKKPWLVKGRLLKGMELRLDGAIDKVEGLAMEVDIDRMMKRHKEEMGNMGGRDIDIGFA